MTPTPPPDADHALARPGPTGPPPPRRWLGPVLLVVSLAWLAGATGYLVGVRTGEPAFGAVDRGFVVDMSDHHDQAVLLAQHQLENGSDPVVLDFAREVLFLQRSELGEMAMLMAQNGVARPDLDLERPTMGWMGMSGTLATMPGWVGADDVEALRTSSGTDADRLFLTLMQQHHTGGAHMSEYAAERAESPELRALANRMARNQRIEVGEYQRVLDRLPAPS